MTTLYGEVAFALSLLRPEDVNPAFPLVNSQDIYPYTAPDDLTDNRQWIYTARLS